MLVSHFYSNYILSLHTFLREGSQCRIDINQCNYLNHMFELFHVLGLQQYNLNIIQLMTEKNLQPPITKDQQIKLVPNSTIKVTPLFVQGEEDVKISTIKFDPLDRYIAAARRDGTILIYNVKNKAISSTISIPEGPKHPFTYITWRPENEHFKTRNILTTTNTAGEIQNWHLNSGKCLSTINVGCQLNCLDYTKDGTKLVVAGNDSTLKVYDEVKRKLVCELKQSNAPYNSHSNRVYCGKFNTQQGYQHLVYSGGWDNTLITWDIRIERPVQNVFGPYVYGDGIATCGMDILTASFKQTDQLQQWDGRKNNCELNQNLDWEGIKVSSVPCFLYTCQFSKKHKDMIAAGGRNANQVKLFDKSSNNKPFCAIYNLPRQIGTLDFSYDDSMLAISGADGYVRVFSISEV